MLSWALRLQREGNEVGMWFKTETQRTGEGLLDNRFKTLNELLAWGEKDPETVYISEGTGNGKDFDKLRKEGKLILGGGRLNDKWEDDRAFAQEIAKAAGMSLPPSTAVENIDEAIKFLQKRQEEEEWYFKPSRNVGSGEVTYCGRDIRDLIRYLQYVKRLDGDMPGVLQQNIDGEVLNVTAWWTGEKFIGPYSYMIEYKRLMPRNIGPNTGCALSTIYFLDQEPRLAKEFHWQTFAKILSKLEAPPGSYDVNGIVQDNGKALYLETGPRFGYDYDMLWPRGLDRPLGDVLFEWAKGKLKNIPLLSDDIYGGVRLSLPPYPWESLHSSEKSALYEPVDNVPDLHGEEFAPYGIMANDEGDLEVGDPYGLVGVAIYSNPDFDVVKKSIYRTIEELHIANLVYRDDYGRQEKESFRRLKGLRYEVPKGA